MNSLVVMAAGVGSRFGGLKQIARLGPSGQTIIDYTLLDAASCGVNHVVFVVREGIRKEFREQVGRYWEGRLNVDYAIQDAKENLLGAPPRERPWGTGHAVAVAMRYINGAYGVVNADDLYGRESMHLLTKSLNQGYSVNVAFALSQTLSEHGDVKRGLCRVADGVLRGVTEIRVRREAFGLVARDDAGRRIQVRPDDPTSMNLWGFQAGFADRLLGGWNEFLSRAAFSEDAEYYLSAAAVDSAPRDAELCRVIRTPERWYGVTYPLDAQAVRDHLAAMGE